MRLMFLPFTPVGRLIEVKAMELKGRMGLPWYESVDPLSMLAAVPARLLLEADLRRLSPTLADALFVQGVNDWSAFAAASGDSGQVIVLNSRHPETRRRASLMEEITHLLLGHPASRLCVGTNGVSVVRSYNDAVEREAFDIGAACLVPYAPLFRQIRYEAAQITALATYFAVSDDLIRYRIKRSGLSAMYRKRCG
jgi:hypothetical protein